MKKTIPFLALLLFSCYSPKSEIEEDKHPSIPEFPKFDSKEIQLIKLVEIPIEAELTTYNFMIKDDFFYIYINGRQDFGNIYEQKKDFIVLSQGKLMSSNSWKDNFSEAQFMDENKNLIIGHWKFNAPNYVKKDSIPIMSLGDVSEKYNYQYHLGDPQRDSVFLNKVHKEEHILQVNTFNRIEEIQPVANYFVANKPFLDNYYFLCNLNSQPFYIEQNFFNKEKKRYYSGYEGIDSLYYEKIALKIKKLAVEENFFSYKIDSIHQDFKFLKEFDAIVTGNSWFSIGNHFLGSCGYKPVYMNYYETTFRGKKIRTKVNNMNQSISEAIVIQGNTYFIVWTKEKLKIYCMPNPHPKDIN